MTGKRLVERDASQRTHVYRSAASEQHTQRELVADLLDRAFAGSAAKLVMQALATGRASEAERAEIRRLLERDSGGTAPVDSDRAPHRGKGDR